MFSEEIPLLLSAAVLIAFIFPVGMIGRLADKASVENGSKWIIGFYSIYLTMVAIASLNGFFDDVMLPPKIVLCTTLPLAIFVTIIFTTSICKTANSNIQLTDLVKIHIFRLIGSTFLFLLALELLPKPFALIAGIGDLTTAVTSIFVAKAIRQNKSYARKLTYVWNTFGLVDILLTSFLAILFTKLSIDNGIQGVEVLVQFPFCFIPAFAPPTIIFLHLLIYRKLTQTKSA